MNYRELLDSAKHLKDEANRTLNGKRRQELRELASDLERQARDKERPH